jgi:hypothetical protein
VSIYRDSQLGLCIDIRGPDGNIFFLWGYAQQLARQTGTKKEWDENLAAAKKIAGEYGDYKFMVDTFREFFPFVTLVGYEEVFNDGE